jgi:hypothetical protein
MDEVAGCAKRKAGEMTDNPKLEVEGMVQQMKGKVENVWGQDKRGGLRCRSGYRVAYRYSYKTRLKEISGECRVPQVQAGIRVEIVA